MVINCNANDGEYDHSNLLRESGCCTLEATGVCFATVKSLRISESAGVHPKKVMDHAALRSDLRSQKS